MMFYAVVGGEKAESKTSKGRWNAVSDRAPAFPILDETLLDGQVNLYSTISEYILFRRNKEGTSDRFFLGVKKEGRVSRDDPNLFLHKQNLGRNTFFGNVKRVCNDLGIRADSAGNSVTTHGLRATMVSLLINAGYYDSTIILRTGHRNIASLRNYHNL